MNTIQDISTFEDIRLFVDEFYAKIRQDDLLASIFQSKIGESWELHLQKMYAFWNAALFGEKGYVGNPFQKHATLPIQGEHFDRWLALFHETIDTRFTGPLAEDAKWRAGVMAHNFQNRLAVLNKNAPVPLV